LLVGAAAIAAAVLIAGSQGDGAEHELEGFLSRWEEGDDRAAAAMTDDRAAARRALTASRRGLDGADVAGEVVSVDEHGRRARARVRLEWRVPGVGPWSYGTRVTLREAGGEWRVRWGRRRSSIPGSSTTHGSGPFASSRSAHRSSTATAAAS
jgi:hypothetical protein